MKNEKTCGQFTSSNILDAFILLFNILLSKTRSGAIAHKLIYEQSKINDLVVNLFSGAEEYNFLDDRLLATQLSVANVSSVDQDDKKEMSTAQALEISKIFFKAINLSFCSVELINGLLRDEKKLEKMVDSLFEMSPAFNLFEYRQYARRAPLSQFKEVCTWDNYPFIVCVADEVCEPWGFKSGSQVAFPHGGYGTVIGVAPCIYGQETILSMWTADDGDAFRNPKKPVVGAWKTPNLKKEGIYLIKK